MYITKPVSEQFRSRANVCVVYVRKTYRLVQMYGLQFMIVETIATSTSNMGSVQLNFYRCSLQVKLLFLDTRTMSTIVNYICESFISLAPGRSPSDTNCGLDCVPTMVYFY